MKEFQDKVEFLKKYYEKFKNYDLAVKKMIDDGIISDAREVSGLTLSEIGYVLGITRERVRQLEEQAKKKIKQYCIKHKIKYNDLY